jgi:phage shock protein PspC (stress-responsive transcriptional regulator)
MTAAAQNTDRTPLPLRGDTFLGVCEAIGQDFGINPNWLRIAFAPFIMFSPVITLSVYLGLGAVVAAARWFYPVEERTAAPSAKAAPVSNEADQMEDRLAA